MKGGRIWGGDRIEEQFEAAESVSSDVLTAPQARDHLTVPLLAMVSELLRQQKELMTIIVAKDKEIDDYKSQGVRTSRSE